MTVEVVELQELVLWLQTGRVALLLGSIHRWTEGRRTDLLSSIYKGLPIGALTVWSTPDRDINTKRSVGHVALAVHDGMRLIVLDGVQRALSLAEMLLPPSDPAAGEFYFDASTERFLYVDGRMKHSVLPMWYPMVHAFDGRALRQTHRRIDAEYDWSVIDGSVEYRESIKANMERLVSMFSSTQLPLIGCPASNVIEAVTRGNFLRTMG